MKLYALKRVDGGVEIMHTDGNPLDMIAKWHPSRQAQVTGEFREIQPADLPANRSQRSKWYDTGTTIGIRA